MSTTLRSIVVLVATMVAIGCRQMSEVVSNDSIGLNGGFEVVDRGMPVNWQIYTQHITGRGDFDVAVDTVVKASGMRSLRFDVRSCDSTGGNRSPGFSREIDVDSGATYKVSFRTRNQGSRFLASVAGVSAWSSGERMIMAADESSDEWQTNECNYVVPAKTLRLRFELNVLRPGTLWVDDVKIERVAPVGTLKD